MVSILIALYIVLPCIFELKNKVLYYMPVAIAIVTILILGAVNSGLKA